MDNKTKNALCPYLDNFPCPERTNCMECPIEQADCIACPAYYKDMPIPYLGLTIGELDEEAEGAALLPPPFYDDIRPYWEEHERK